MEVITHNARILFVNGGRSGGVGVAMYAWPGLSGPLA